MRDLPLPMMRKNRTRLLTARDFVSSVELEVEIAAKTAAAHPPDDIIVSAGDHNWGSS